VFGGRGLDSHAGIGAALFPRDGWTSGSLLESADMALYAAKVDARWRASGVAFGRIVVNISDAEFVRGDLPARVLDRLEAAGLPTDAIALELTETVLLGKRAAQVNATLRCLAGAGVRIALDSFGIDFALIVPLQRFPIDVIKIGRSFVRGVGAGIGADPGAAAIVRALVGLGRDLGMETVGEGVETAEQADWLRAGLHARARISPRPRRARRHGSRAGRIRRGEPERRRRRAGCPGLARERLGLAAEQRVMARGATREQWNRRGDRAARGIVAQADRLHSRLEIGVAAFERTIADIAARAGDARGIANAEFERRAHPTDIGGQPPQCRQQEHE
jgi:predicted signal transduction protein with EAL and GGDEF domain